MLRASAADVLRMRKRRSAGLGSEYERLVMQSPGVLKPLGDRRLAQRAANALLSWLFSLVVAILAPFSAFGIAAALIGPGPALLPFLAVVIVVIVAWRRSHRRYGGPLVRVVSHADYRRFSQWETTRQMPNRRWKIDLRLVKRVESDEP